MKKYYTYVLLIPISLGLLTGCHSADEPTNEAINTGSIKDKINENKQINSEEKSSSDENTEEQTPLEEAQPTSSESIPEEPSEEPQTAEELAQNATLNTMPWTPEKAAQLKQFMLSWQQEMGQYYKEATNNQPLYRYGMIFPDDILPGADRYNWAYGPYKEGVVPQGITIHYDPSGISAADYTVVAVYVADHPQWGSQERAYFFALTQQQEPIVFLLTQNQALPDEKIHVISTENRALQQGFADIVHQTN